MASKAWSGNVKSELKSGVSKAKRLSKCFMRCDQRDLERLRVCNVHWRFTYVQQWPGVGRTESTPPVQQSAGWGGRWTWYHWESHPGSLPHITQTLRQPPAPATRPGSKIRDTGIYFASVLFSGTILLALVWIIFSCKHKYITLPTFIVDRFMLVELILSNI